MQITNISEAKASLSHLVKMVQEMKEPIIIGKAGKPVAIFSAYQKDTSPRKLGGSWEGPGNRLPREGHRAIPGDVRPGLICVT